MIVTRTRTVPETDVALMVARDFLLAALAWPWDGDPVSRAIACWRRVDELLEQRLELQRAAQDREVEAWWRESWPGTQWPAWPDQAPEVAS